MVKTLTQALEMVNNSLSTKLHKQKAIETFLESNCAIDSEFLIFKDSYLPIAPRNSKIFQYLENEQFLSACSLNESLKIYRQIIKFKRAIPAPTTFKVISNKIIHSDIDRIDSSDLVKVLQSYLKFRVVPSDEMLNWIPRAYERNRGNYAVILYVTKLYFEMRIRDWGNYKEFEESIKDILNESLITVMKQNKYSEIYSIIDLANDLCYGENWENSELWGCILDIVANNLSPSSFKSSVQREFLPRKLSPMYSLPLFRILDALSLYSPSILSSNSSSISRISSHLGYSPSDIVKSETTSYTQTQLASCFSQLGVSYEPSKVLDKYYSVDFFIPPRKVIEYHGIYHYLRTIDNAKTHFEDGSTVFKEKLLRSRGYDYLKIPYYEFNSLTKPELLSKLTNYITN